jgi:hypothetical protein
MAIATRVDTVTLELSLEEADTLKDLIGHKVSGSFTSRRKFTSAIWVALVDAGIKGTLCGDFGNDGLVFFKG